MSQPEPIVQALAKIRALQESPASTPSSQSSVEPKRCPTCYGLGGKGTERDEYGLSYFKAWCLCEAGPRAKAAYEQKRADKEAAGAPACNACRGEGGFDRYSTNEFVSGFRKWCDCEFGQQAQEKFNAEAEEARREADDNRLGSRLGFAEIPLRYQCAELSQFSETAAGKEVEDWLNDDNRTENGIFIWGPVGTGKTHLAAGLLSKMIHNGSDGYFIAVPDLLDRIRSSYSEHRDEDRMLKRVTNDKLVVLLDDLGAERITDWAREKLYQIINHRYNDCADTIVTSNLSPDELSEQIGDRTVSRLIGMCKVIKVDGDDRRLKGQ